MTVIPLGTASAVPTRSRHLSATAVLQAGRIVLFDCGEGTQNRLMDAGLRHGRIEAICITHLHGDHYFGIFGLLSTMVLSRRMAPLSIIAPEPLAESLDGMAGLGQADRCFRIRHVAIPEGFGSGVVYEDDRSTIVARPLDHRVFTLGYRIQERPRAGNLDVERARALGIDSHEHYRQLKRGEAVTLEDGSAVYPEEVVSPPPAPLSFAYIMDTQPCRAAVRLAADATLVLHDATFGEAHRQRARRTGHSTAREAAGVARKARARRLLLGHFSARYRDVSELVREAEEVFPRAEAAVELERYVLEPV